MRISWLICGVLGHKTDLCLTDLNPWRYPRVFATLGYALSAADLNPDGSPRIAALKSMQVYICRRCQHRSENPCA
jgi:hypothetical protein